MSSKTGIWIALTTGVLAGCAPMPPSNPPAVAPPAATPGVTTLAACGVTVARRKCSSNTCTVTVTLSGTGSSAIPMVDPDELVIDTSGPVDIVWELPVGAEFVAARQDGIYVPKNDRDQFAFNYPTHKKNGLPGNGKKGQYYHWQFENSAAFKYKYTLRFRVGMDVYECDPLINNQGGGG